ncbi:hypothetical protein HMPREF3201_01615, partial [Megasphaera sp. MJR8396C]
MGNTTLKFSYRDLMLNRSFSPLTGKWVIRPKAIEKYGWLFKRFQSPYGEMGNTTTKLSKLPIKQLSTSFSPLTGKWVIRHALLCDGRNGITAGFQSPYGEMG